MSTLLSFLAALAFLATVWWTVDRCFRLRADRRHSGPDSSGPYLDTPATLTVSPAELTVTYEGFPSESITWVSVSGMSAYKVDLFSVDLICLEFRRRDGSAALTIHEDMTGYAELTAALPSLLPGYTNDWIQNVATPAFATNERVIWERSAPTPS